jgi:two-component system OmpR family response regulator
LASSSGTDATTSLWQEQVVVLRWPEEEVEAARLEALEVPHLLLVEPDAAAPHVTSCFTDWVRLPADDMEIRARVATLRARSERHPSLPTIDSFGTLSFRGESIFLSLTDERLMRVLVEHFGRGVTEDDLTRRVWSTPVVVGRIRVRISRLRKRIQPLGLEITWLRGRGYRLHGVSEK